jgi:hypothetical protein
MAFYQNVFENDFIGHLLLEDRQYVLDFKVPANVNRPGYMFAWGTPTYNLVGNTTLTINYSIDAGKTYYALALTLTSGATRSAAEVAADLNANTNFFNLFEAKVVTAKDGIGRLMLQAKLPNHQFKAYVSNSSAETVLRFNARAGVAELPDYFDRHTVTNFMNKGPGGTNEFPDSQGCLVKLTIPTDNWYITNAGFTATAQADYLLLRGRSLAFMFKKQTVDGSSRITQIIEYPAGAKVGDLAKKTTMTYTAAQTEPDQIAEIPYVLTSGDLITP